MKTQVISLESHDDVASIRDKMGWSKTGRVLLVWPDKLPKTGGHLPSRKFDLALLLHASASLGLQLALVCTDTTVCAYAAELDIPVFDTIRQAQQTRWRSGRKLRSRLERLKDHSAVTILQQPRAKPVNWQGHFLVRAVSFTIAILSVLLLAVAIVPQARISLTPHHEMQTVAISVRASTDQRNVALTGEIPAYTISAIVETQGVIRATGSITAPVSQAEGNVRFTNLTDHVIVIPEDTLVSNQDKTQYYAVKKEGRLPGRAGANVLLPVRAVTPGSAGNIAARQVVRLEGPLSFQATVVNLTPISGGKQIITAAPEAADRERLYSQLLDQLRRAAKSELESNLASGDILVSTPVLTSTIEKRYFPPFIEPASQLSLTLRLQFEAQAVQAVDLEKLAQLALDANLAPGFAPLPGKIAIESLSQPEMGGDAIIRWRIRVQRTIQTRLSEVDAAESVRGRTPSEALLRLADLPLSAPPRLVLSPAWWPRIPLIPSRIVIETAQN